MEEGFDLRKYMDNLIDQESSAQWRPFPDRYINTRQQMEIIIPQISLTKKPVYVYCKITDDFTTMQQYSLDEDSLPPKVLCWNDLSALDYKMATKTVKVGIEHEYKYHIDDLTISFESVSYGNDEPLPNPATNPDNQLIYHILDPTLTKSSRITPVPKAENQQVQSLQKMKVSKSSSQLKYMTENKTPIVVQTTQQPPIQQDAPNIRKLCEHIPKDTIFILDCSFADDCLKTIIEKRRDVIVFAATQESLLYNPQLPCDLFTSCLLTPAKVAILWQSQSYSDIHSGLLSEIDIQSLIDILNDSPIASEILKLLENALEAYVDQMASEILAQDQQLFYRIFRKDTLTARLFANFVFAVRMMKTVSTLPTSYPELPDMSKHDLWDSFYLQVDRALYSLKESMLPKPRNVFSNNQLLEEQLNCLESWLWFPKDNRLAPMELPFIYFLLNSPNHFKKAVDFTSHFLEISPDTTKQFLNTRCFPLLPKLLESKTLHDADADTVAHFTFIIVNCVLLSPSLAKSFENMVSFWIDHVRSDCENLVAASMSMLLLYADSPDKIKQYKASGFEELFETYSKHKNMAIRTLANLLLTKMGIGLLHPLDQIQNEPSPQCRAAIVSRITTTMDSEESDDELRSALIYDLILLVNDPYPPVREEALIALSHALHRDNGELLSSLNSYITDWRDDKAKNPIVTLLGHELQIMMFEPSKRVNERLNEFLRYLASRFTEEKNTEPLHSNLSRSCVSDISHPSHSNLNPLTFSSNAMVVTDCTLEGRPSMSPSGMLSCADNTGQLHCQVTIGGQTTMTTFDYFKPGLDFATVPHHFGFLTEQRRGMRSSIDYQAFIDDSRMLAISNRSQVTIINFNRSNDAESAFWMAPPDATTKVVVDYNDKAFQILHSSGSSLVHIFDIESQKKLDNIKVPRTPTVGMQWLKPYSNLFYVAQSDLLLYDSRMRGTVASIQNGGIDFLTSNCSASMPHNIVVASKGGGIKMYDMRNMQAVAFRDIGTRIKQFEVHRQLPYGVILTNNCLYSLSFEDYELTPETQENMAIPDAFGLHMSESTCAVRSGNTVKTCVIYY